MVTFAKDLFSFCLYIFRETSNDIVGYATGCAFICFALALLWAIIKKGCRV